MVHVWLTAFDAISKGCYLSIDLSMSDNMSRVTACLSMYEVYVGVGT